MFCQKCGAELPDDADRCLNCGAGMYKTTEIEQEIELEGAYANKEARSKIILFIVILLILCGAALAIVSLFNIMDTSDAGSNAAQSSIPTEESAFINFV